MPRPRRRFFVALVGTFDPVIAAKTYATQGRANLEIVYSDDIVIGIVGVVEVQAAGMRSLR